MKKMTIPSPRHEITLEHNGVLHRAEYSVDGDFVTLYSDFGSSTRQQGNSEASSIARQMLNVFVKGFR
jgi:hypothetical protein